MTDAWEEWMACSEPAGQGALWVLGPEPHAAPGPAPGPEPGPAPHPTAGEMGALSAAPAAAAGQFTLLDAARRRALRQQLAAGELDRLVFRGVTFRARYPNANYLRFRDADLPGLAASFAGVPFLRDHNAAQIAARGGTVTGSLLDGDAFVQTVELTVPDAIEAFLNGQMDRFSIAWHWQAITCSVCQADWLSAACGHWPGRKYRRHGPGGHEAEVLCELIFEAPRGKEVSAVNAPAVAGTGVRAVLAQLCELKAGRAAGWAAGGGPQAMEEEMGMADESIGTVEQAAAPGAGTVGDCPTAGGAGADTPGPGQVPGAEAAALAAARELLAAQRQAVLDSKLAASGLPAEMHELVRGALPAGWGVAELDRKIAQAVAAWARLEERRTVTGMQPRPGQGRIAGMLTGLDQLSLALDGLLGGRRPERDVRPLSGIREFYVLLSGDYEMRGVFRPEHVGLAAVDSSTMAGLVASALNKVVVNQFAAYPRWWEPIVTSEDFATLQQARWITLGDVGELPTVAEGGAFTEMAWDDQTETADWVKKGGYLGLTLEAIDRDDTRRIQQAGPALARAAYITLGKTIARIFTANSGAGPAMSDGNALFHAAHNNLGTTALSYAAWDAVRVAMRKQTELNSGERLGGLVVPKFLLVPPELEGTAVQIMAGELQPGQANFNENVYAEGNTHEARLAAARRRVIVVDFWTDANDWAVAADPSLYPSIGLGFRFGREPEIFSVASANSGLMFTNDILPIKVRFFFAAGPTDWRGLYKQNVA